ncbi:hypothetical protein BpHYR1_028598 [Brachionus plicatilis]|uniref:Uncharacterized protein n=1 Tax=Brachionus plicatilis TaxID=10195 RepID=A0A3M7P1W1_BRAPC|nr:hypothetical protein BpHYR1_028598 [Brachionus plicatilis]
MKKITKSSLLAEICLNYGANRKIIFIAALMKKKIYYEIKHTNTKPLNFEIFARFKYQEAFTETVNQLQKHRNTTNY